MTTWERYGVPKAGVSIVANQNGNESGRRSFLLGIFFLLFSPLGVLAAVHFLEPDEGGGVVVLLLGFLYFCGVFLLLRSQPAASRQSQSCRRTFIAGIILVILAPVGLLAIAFYVAIAAFGAGLGDAPASSFWSAPFVLKVGLATVIPVVMFGCGVYQLIRSRSSPPDQPTDVGG